MGTPRTTDPEPIQPSPERLALAARRAYAAAPKARWDDGRIRERYARRSLEAIRGDGDACYMNPCLDYALLMADDLARGGGQARVEAAFGRSVDGHDAAHFWTVWETPEGPWYAEQRRLNDVRVAPGDTAEPYAGWTGSWRQTLVDARDLDPRLPLPELARGAARTALRAILDAKLDRLVACNSQGDWERFLGLVRGNVTRPRILTAHTTPPSLRPAA